MKKKFWFLAAVGLLVAALAAPAAFGAATGNDQKQTQNQQYVDQMFNSHQQWLDQATKSGDITPEQAKNWQDHFNSMRDFHQQNGFGPMGQMMGGMMGNGGMMGSGGMMGNFNFGSNQQPNNAQ